MNAELLAQIEKAREAGKRARQTQPVAEGARYLPEEHKLELTLKDGKILKISVDQLQGLEGASNEDLATVELTPSGLGLHWEPLDADLLVSGLVEGVYGTKAWMRAIGAQGGKATTKKKRGAARRNGRLGGRRRDGSRSEHTYGQRAGYACQIAPSPRFYRRVPEFRVEREMETFFGCLVTGNGYKVLSTNSFASVQRVYEVLINIQSLVELGTIGIVQRQTDRGFIISLINPEGGTLATSKVYKNKSAASRIRGRLPDLISSAVIAELQESG